ncbi:MAG: MBL fold metallo-hydrolase [Polyangiaceae bacterium]|nr:MBL fold metallo-hydrolase [Polyangiaceae bacterium]
MKALHRSDLWAWSRFDEARNLDFHAWYWAGPGGGTLVDPLPLGAHDRAHLAALGGAKRVVVTNSDHLRAAVALASELGAELLAPAGERGTLDAPVTRWIADGDELEPGLTAIALEGSKTPGELALVLERTTLLTGDLVRAHVGGRLTLLPDAKLRDRAAAIASLRRLVTERPDVDAVLVGDGWPVFRDGHARLVELLDSLTAR